MIKDIRDFDNYRQVEDFLISAGFSEYSLRYFTLAQLDDLILTVQAGPVRQTTPTQPKGEVVSSGTPQEREFENRAATLAGHIESQLSKGLAAHSFYHFGTQEQQERYVMAVSSKLKVDHWVEQSGHRWVFHKCNKK